MGEREQTARGAAPFAVKDCALISIATGVRAQTLREFRDGLLEVSPGSIYHHLWGRLLRPRFDEPEYNNDFASWAFHGLHEKPLAERLSMVNPTDFQTLEDVRQELAELVDQRLDESDMVPWARADQQFHFLQARIVILDTGIRIDDPVALAAALPDLPTGAVYYHFIDARRRTEQRCDDFSAWLKGFEERHVDLIRNLAAIDPYFSSLKEIRRILAETFRSHAPAVEHG